MNLIVSDNNLTKVISGKIQKLYFAFSKRNAAGEINSPDLLLPRPKIFQVEKIHHYTNTQTHYKYSPVGTFLDDTFTDLLFHCLP